MFYIQKRPLSNSTRLCHRPKARVMSALLARLRVVAPLAADWIREEAAHTVLHTAREAYAVLRAKRVSPLPRDYCLIQRVPRLTAVRILLRPAVTKPLMLLDERGDTRLLQLFGRHARMRARAAQVVIVAVHAPPVLREAHLVACP